MSVYISPGTVCYNSTWSRMCFESKLLIPTTTNCAEGAETQSTLVFHAVVPNICKKPQSSTLSECLLSNLDTKPCQKLTAIMRNLETCELMNNKLVLCNKAVHEPNYNRFATKYKRHNTLKPSQRPELAQVLPLWTLHSSFPQRLLP